MTRGVSHPLELRAEVVAAVLAGTSIVQVAAQFKLDKGLVSRWVKADQLQAVATDQRARSGSISAERPKQVNLESPVQTGDIGELIYDLIAQHVVTLSAQLQAAARPDWLAKQPAAELAQLVTAERDTLIRLLAGLRPAEPSGRPALGDGIAGSVDAAG